MLPSARLIFRFGYFTNKPLNSHASIVPAVRDAPHAMLATKGALAEIFGITDDEPMCMHTTTPVSLHAAHTGSQYPLGSWMSGKPNGVGFSENASARTPRAAIRSTSRAA